jgi:hypothetical protein
MARIRTIKPEFFLHEELAELPPLHRLLFVGLWTLADREGRLEDRPKRIKVSLLPYDDADVDAMLADLDAAGFIVRYLVDGAKYIEIPSFSTHQRITGREASCPTEIPGKQQGSTGETTGKQQGSTGETTGITGREGKGREGKGTDTRNGDARVRADEPTARVEPHPDAGALPTRRRKAHCAWESARGLDVPHELHAELLGKMAPRDEPALLRWYAETERDWRDLPVGDTCWAFWRARFREWVGTTVTPLVPDKPDTSGWATAALTAVPR